VNVLLKGPELRLTSARPIYLDSCDRPLVARTLFRLPSMKVTRANGSTLQTLALATDSSRSGIFGWEIRMTELSISVYAESL